MIAFCMLFNSYDFIFLFFIPVVIVFYFFRPKNILLATWFLIVASVVFYAQWNLVHLGVLLGSIVINYSFSVWLLKTSYNRNWLVGFMVGLNLLPLAYFKYSFFLHVSDHSLVLPLAISFFTFQQIAFLVDTYKGRVKVDGFKEYLFFVLFFPQLVAGPIVHYNELIPQIKQPRFLHFNKSNFNAGLVLFSIGLFKKVVLADSLGLIANNAFSDSSLSSYEAWRGIVAYSFQIYFDFSGYADMAIALALFFGIKLPVNFNSPYKSKNIVEFWRNWHITLSNFLKDYIYIPLGGSRVKIGRQAFNLLATMGLGGLWHGAGWNFIVWGIAHGVCLAVLHVWNTIFCQLYIVAKASHDGCHKAKALTHRLQRRYNIQLAKNLLSILFTFFVVTLLWVLFRATDLSSALVYYGVLFDFGTFKFVGFTIEKEFLIIVSFVVIWTLPNSLEFIGYSKDRFTLKLWHSFVGGVLFFLSLKMMASSPAVSFVYFNF